MLKLFLCICFTFSSFANDDWVFSSNKKGVIVYKKPIDPDGIVPFKAVTIVDYPLVKVAAVMNDTYRRPDWAKRLYAVKIIHEAGAYERTEYFKIRTPFLMWDRDFIVWYKIQVLDQGKQLLVTAKSVQHKDYPPQDRLIRGEMISGEMRLLDMGNKTKISMVSYINPKGSVPKWIVNLFTEGISRKMIQLMIKQIEKNLYTPQQLQKISRAIHDYLKLPYQGGDAPDFTK